MILETLGTEEFDVATLIGALQFFLSMHHPQVILQIITATEPFFTIADLAFKGLFSG